MIVRTVRSNSRIATCRSCRGVPTWKHLVGDVHTATRRRRGRTNGVCDDCSGDGIVLRQRKRVGRRGQR